MKRNYLAIVACILCVFIVGCEKKPIRFQESGANRRFIFNHDVTFEQYIYKTRRMIEKTRVDLNSDNKKIILDANSPFELKPDQNISLKTRDDNVRLILNSRSKGRSQTVNPDRHKPTPRALINAPASVTHQP